MHGRDNMERSGPKISRSERPSYSSGLPSLCVGTSEPVDVNYLINQSGRRGDAVTLCL